MERVGEKALINGRVWGHPDCDAILVRGSLVAAIGRSAEVARDIETIDARGGSILPGFIDGHTHLAHSGLVESGWTLDIAGCERDEAVDRIRRAARARTAGEWLTAYGWDESRWSPPNPLRQADLDRAAPGVAVAAIRVDGHLAVLGSAAAKRARPALARETTFFDASTGEVREEAVDAVRRLARPDAGTWRDGLLAAARACHRVGITTAHAMSDLDDPQDLLERATSLRLRLVVHPPAERLQSLIELGIATGDGDAWGRWGGVKLFADGSVGARNAAFSRPYRGGGRGRLNRTLRDLTGRLWAADHAGWQTLTHAIGDRAIARVLSAHRRAATNPGRRHRIEHCEFPTAPQIRAMRALGLAICVQPNFIGNWSGRGLLYETALGGRRDAACNPLRAWLAAGIPLGFGSDGMPLSPLYGILSAVRAQHPGQRATLVEAVDGYTVGAAGLSDGLPSSGTLAVGSPADLVVLDGPVDAPDLERRAVVQTWVDGAIVYGGTEGQ